MTENLRQADGDQAVAIRERERRSSRIRVGQWASLAIGLGYLAIGIMMMLDPAERYRGEEYMVQAYLHPFIPQLWRALFVVVAFLTIMWITAGSDLIRRRRHEFEGVFHWARICAYAACVISAVQWYKEIFNWRFIENFTAREPLYREITLNSGIGMDPDYIWMFGVLGFWYFISSFLAWRGGVFRPLTNILGYVSGLALILTMIFAITDLLIYFPNGGQMAVMQFTSLLGGVAGALYHVIAFFDIRRILAAEDAPRRSPAAKGGAR